MNFGLCDGDVYILLITSLPNGMGDDVWKRGQKTPRAPGQNMAAGYVGDHGLSQVVLCCKKLSFCSVPFEICN